MSSIMPGYHTLVLVLAILKIAECRVNWDPACGVSKGCFPDCRSQSCDYLITWRNTGMNSLQFTVVLDKTPVPDYLAIGFSSDYRMGDDSVVGCIVSRQQCYSYYNSGTDSEILSPSNLGIRQFAESTNNGITSFNFTRQFSLKANSQFFDIVSQQYILMFVYGETKVKKGYTQLSKHPLIPYSSDGTVDFTTNQIIPLRKLNTPVVKLHGIVMTLAWLLFSCVAIVTARYNKLMLKRHKLFGTQIWFQVHRGLMLLVIGFVIAGLVSIFVGMGGYSQLDPPPGLAVTGAHPVFGIIIATLAFINVIAGFIRPGGDHKWRWLFNWAHLILGVLIQLLAVSTVLIGYRMERAMLPLSVLYVGITQLVLTVVVCVLIDLHRWRLKKTQDSLKDGVSDPAVWNGRKSASEVYFYVLLAYGTTMLVLTLVTVGLIATS